MLFNNCKKTLIASLLIIVAFGHQATAQFNESISYLFEQAYSVEHVDPDSAIQLYRYGFQLAVTLDSANQQAHALYFIGLVQMNQGQFDSAAYYIKQAISIFESEKNTSGLIKTMTGLANVYNYQGDHEPAITQYHQALSYALEINDVSTQLRILNNLATIYNQAGRYEQCFITLRSAEELALSIDHKAYLGDIHNNYSNNYNSVDSVQLAIFHANKAIEYYQQAGDKLYEALAQSNLSAFLMGLIPIDFTSAEKALIRSRLLLDSLDAPGLEANYFKHLAYYHLHKEDYEPAEKAALQSLEFQKQFDSKPSKSQIYEVLYKIKKAGNRPAESLAYYEQFVAIKDSLIFEESHSQLQELEAKFQSIQKDNQIVTQEILLNKHVTQRNLLITTALGLILLALFIYYRSRKNRILSAAKIENLEKQQKLIALDYMVQGQEEERKRIAQDLHDGLGGLLASVRLQMQKIHKEIAKFGEINLFDQAEKMINHAHMEVRRIAHDMMPGALIDLGLIDAIEDLLEKTKIEQNLAVHLSKPNEDIGLSEAQSVNLYRIVQEILNNTIKHAEAGTVDISLQIENEKLILNISDDGTGFDYKQAMKKEGMGLHSIESRVKYLEGVLEVDSVPGKGTKYKMEIPMRGSEHG